MEPFFQNETSNKHGRTQQITRKKLKRQINTKQPVRAKQGCQDMHLLPRNAQEILQSHVFSFSLREQDVMFLGAILSSLQDATCSSCHRRVPAKDSLVVSCMVFFVTCYSFFHVCPIEVANVPCCFFAVSSERLHLLPENTCGATALFLQVSCCGFGPKRLRSSRSALRDPEGAPSRLEKHFDESHCAHKLTDSLVA